MVNKRRRFIEIIVDPKKVDHRVGIAHFCVSRGYAIGVTCLCWPGRVAFRLCLDMKKQPYMVRNTMTKNLSYSSSLSLSSSLHALINRVPLHTPYGQ